MIRAFEVRGEHHRTLRCRSGEGLVPPSPKRMVPPPFRRGSVPPSPLRRATALPSRPSAQKIAATVAWATSGPPDRSAAPAQGSSRHPGCAGRAAGRRGGGWLAPARPSRRSRSGSGDPPRSDSAASRAGTGYAAEKVESSDRTMPRVAGLDRRTRRRWTVAGVPSRCRREACCAPSPIAFSADQRITCSTRRSSDWNSTATTAPASARRNTRSMTPRAGVTTATSSSGRHAGWSTRRNASTIQAWARSRTGMPAPGTIRTDRSAPRASAILARVGSRGSRDPDSRRPTVTGWTCAARATAAVARPASSRSVRTSRPSPLRMSALRRADRIRPNFFRSPR